MPYGTSPPRPVRRAHRANEPHTVPQVSSPAASGRLSAALTGELTRFQWTIVRLVADGLTDAMIAAELGTTLRTVQTEVVRARTRLDASNRAHLAAIAVRRGII